MTVVSLEWLAWMALTVAAYWLSPRTIRGAIVPIATAAFLGRAAPASLVALFVVAAIAYLGAQRFPGRPGVTCALIVVPLVIVKLPIHHGANEPIVLLGLAYYVLRCVHYVVEASHARLPAHGLDQFVRYLFFLPTLIAGPIHRFEPFARELRRLRWDAATFSLGLERVLFGYVKIGPIGNVLLAMKATHAIGALRGPHPALFEYLDCVRYGTTLYAQFSGYSDVAIGFGMLLGHRVMENFDHPFTRQSLGLFWQSWHISLTSFCRDYVYMPMLALTRTSWFAVVVSMVAIGCWHEISPRYLVWGGLHGTAILLGRRVARVFGNGESGVNEAAPGAVGRWVGTIATMNFVFLSFILTKEENLGASWAALRRLVGAA